MNIATARQAIASALSAVTGLNAIKTRTVKSPRAGDGWVLVGQAVPGDTNETYAATFTAVLILGPDENTAETRMEQLTVPVLDAISKHPTLRASDVVVEPVLIPAGETNPGSLYALTLTLSLEVD